MLSKPDKTEPSKSLKTYAKVEPELLKQLLAKDEANRKRNEYQARREEARSHKPKVQKVEVIEDFSEAKGDVFDFPSPLHLFTVLRPDITLYDWQAELLLQLGGFLDTSHPEVKYDINPETPLKLAIAAANGSGKDEIILATFKVWFSMVGKYNLSVATSASFDQLKYQTQAGIKILIKLANKLFGKTFHMSEFHHTCIPTASEIKLFATNEPGRAEGYHPRNGGKLAININEAKTVESFIFDALQRCTGYSYWLEISSPGIKSGDFYAHAMSGSIHPDPITLGTFHHRRVTAHECLHIPRSHIAECYKTKPISWVKSSIEAEFSDWEEDNVISDELWHRPGLTYPPTDDIYALGGDLAGGGDENSLYLRKGNKIVDEFHFHQKDTTLTAPLIHEKFQYILNHPYVADFDDGNVGQAIIDSLVKLGWKIRRRNNQGSSIDKRAFLNFGAESYFHLRRLIENSLHRPKTNDPILNRQITSRLYDTKNNGKFRLEDKKSHRSRCKESPDRADAYVLCFYSMPIKLTKAQQSGDAPSKLSLEEFMEKLAWGEIPRHKLYGNKHNGKSKIIHSTCISSRL